MITCLWACKVRTHTQMSRCALVNMSVIKCRFAIMVECVLVCIHARSIHAVSSWYGFVYRIMRSVHVLSCLIMWPMSFAKF